MQNDLLNSIDALLNATAQVQITENHDSPYMNVPHGQVAHFQLHATQSTIGRLKGFAIQEGISVSNFIEYCIRKELDLIEKERNITIKPVDPSTRMSAGNFSSPERKLNTIMRRFHNTLEKFKKEELKENAKFTE